VKVRQSVRVNVVDWSLANPEKSIKKVAPFDELGTVLLDHLPAHPVGPIDEGDRGAFCYRVRHGIESIGWAELARPRRLSGLSSVVLCKAPLRRKGYGPDHQPNNYLNEPRMRNEGEAIPGLRDALHEFIIIERLMIQEDPDHIQALIMLRDIVVDHCPFIDVNIIFPLARGEQ